MRPIRIPNFVGGINTGVPLDQINDNQSPDMANFTVVDGVLCKRTGYTNDAKVSDITTGTSANPFYGGHHYFDGASGGSAYWALTRSNGTNGRAWSKLTINGDWDDRTGTAKIQTGLDQMVSFAELVNFDTYYNNLFVCQNHTNMLTALNGTLSGDESVVWFTTSPTTNLAPLTGADGYNATASNTSHRAKQVVDFEGSLFLINIYEETKTTGWKALPFRVRWSDAQKFTNKADWDDTDSSSLAGYWDGRQGQGYLMRAEKLRSNMLIYCSKAIVSCMKNNSSTAPFVFLTRVPGLGLYGPRLLTAAKGIHYFVGSDKQIYAYSGGGMPQAIGDKIRTEFFDSINKAPSGDYLVRNRSFSCHFSDINAVGFCMVTGSTSPDTIWMFFYNTGRWEKITLASGQSITGMGEFMQPSGKDAVNMPIFGDADGNVYNWDYSTATDAGTNIDAYVCTKDLIIEIDNEINIPQLYFEAKSDDTASSCDVSISYDQGATWPTGYKTTVTVGNTWKSHKISLNVGSGYRIRIKFGNNTDKTLKIGRIRIETENNGEVI